MVREFAPSIVLALVGSIAAGFLLARLWTLVTRRVTDAPSAIITQFAGTFMVWIAAEHLGLSGILTIVVYAITIARSAPARTPARLRVPSYAVWETVGLRAQRARLHADRHAAAADLERARRDRARRILRLRGRRAGSR